MYLDGSKLEKTGFQLERPYLEISSLQVVIIDFVDILFYNNVPKFSGSLL